MLLNPFRRRTATILGCLVLAGGAIASSGSVALASSSQPHIVATVCKTNGEKIYSVGAVNGSSIQLWYSSTCRSTWAVEINGIAGNYIYVYNEDTGQTENATVQETGQRTVTDAVNDAGTQSQACEQVAHDVTCTGFF
jgi:Protein of unknown function (DUF2690)